MKDTIITSNTYNPYRIISYRDNFNKCFFLLIYYNSEYRYIYIKIHINPRSKIPRQKEGNMFYGRLEKINIELLNIKSDLLNSNFTQSAIADCVLEGIPEIIQLIEAMDNVGYSDSMYKKTYAMVNSFISLVDGTRLLTNFKVIRHHLEMFTLE